MEWSFNWTVDNWRLRIGNHDMCTGYAKTIKLYAEFWGYHNLVAERLQRFSQQFFITIRPVRCTIHFGRVKKVYPISTASVNSSVILHRRHDSYPCSPDRRPISSIHSVLMFCIPYHLFHLFLRSVEKAFFFIERTHLFHFLVIQFEIEKWQYSPWYNRGSMLREWQRNLLEYASEELSGREIYMYLGYLSDDRLNNAPLDIAPPNRNQQVMWIP